MSDSHAAPDATLYRLSLYHCYLGEFIRVGAPPHITSRQLAEELNVKEETVRRDISFMGEIGRPGAGYEPAVLQDALTRFLGLSAEYPIIEVGTVAMLESLQMIFPPDRYGVRPVAYFSELPQDAGSQVNGVPVHHLTELIDLHDIGAKIALVACSPGWVQIAVDMLSQAGVTGILLLTPIVKVRRPEGLHLTQLRMPCDIKSLACKCQVPVGTVGTIA
jgi:redox-sensing transcriptional repressor